MNFTKTQIGLFVALLLGNAIILFSNLDWIWLRLPSALALTFVLPGWAWLPVFGWMKTNRGLDRIVLVGGLSSLFAALVLLLIVLLPGPFTETPVLIAFSLTTLTGLIAQSIFSPKTSIPHPNPKIKWPSRTTLIILFLILGVAAFTHLTRIDYAEFHEDELENMRMIVRAYKGEEFAPFLDSKGPIHWLLPAALWYLNGWLTEGIARTPFAITSLLLIPTLYVLGQRISKRDDVGLIAAAFVAVNGFYVAYARYVENPSLIVLWGVLAMWFAYRYYKEKINGFLLWGAFALAIGLITHPDVLLYLPVFAYVVWRKLYDNRSWKQDWPWIVGASALFLAVTAIFYLPYLFDPNIAATRQYFAEERIGQSLLYNRVANLFDQDALYSTRYHAPVLVVLFVWILIRNFGQWRWRGWAILGVLYAAIITTVVFPDAWIVGRYNLAFIPYALLTLMVLVLPRTTFEIKTLVLWMMVPLGGLLFLAKDAADHIQIAYTAWALLAALAFVDVWLWLTPENSTTATPVSPVPANTVSLSANRSPNLGLEEQSKLWTPGIADKKITVALKAIIIAVLVVIIGLILFYQHLAFLAPVTTYWQAKIDSTYNPNSIYNYLYGTIPRPRKIFSNPRLGGWKAVGYLWETGTLSGDFRSVSESFAVPIWYTFQTPRSCYTDPQHYWLRRDWKGWPAEEQDIVEQGYTLTRVVLVDQQPKLHLYEKNAPPGEPEIVDMEDYRHAFDRMATPARFAQGDVISQPASLNFGDKLLLRGYNVPATVQAGQLLPVDVYWETLAPMDTRYRAFVHLVDAQGNRRAQHDDDPACRLLTTDMRPGQLSARQFRLAVDPATPPGEYTVVLGIYHPDTFDRLDIWDNLVQQSPGNSVVLGQVRVN